MGQLIDLGADITAPPPSSEAQPQGGDIVAQLAELGITSQPTAATSTQQTDEFDVFAKSRTAYGGDQ